MIDRRKLKVSHGIISGTLGSGVPFCTENEILNILRTSEDQVIMLDLYGEYTVLAKGLGGKVINFNFHNPAHINLFDIYGNDEANFLNEKADFLIKFFETILKTPIGALQKAIISKCVKSVYNKYLSVPYDKSKINNKDFLPTIREFYEELKSEYSFDARNIILALNIFLDEMDGWFLGKTDVSFDNKFIVFNLGNISKEYKEIVLLAILELIKTHFINSREDRISSNKYIWLYIDDFSSITIDDYHIRLHKIARRYLCVLTYVTRNITDILANNNSHPIIMNCGYIQLLKHKSSDSDYLIEYLDIPREYITFITNRSAREGLIWEEGSYLHFFYRLCDKENTYEMIQENIDSLLLSSNTMIRKSTTDDKEPIQQLMKLCFGDKNNLEPYENLEDRYYLYFKDDTLVAMTGLTANSEYGHLEIDWTCTHPEHRHKGYMKKLFTEMLNCVREPVYCSCWRLPNNDIANLHTLMSLFDFEEVIPSRVHWKVPHNCFRNYEGGCSYCTGVGCECYEDLFLRKDKIADMEG